MLRYIFKNIRSSIRTAPVMSLLYVICTAAASLAVLFSHGVYQNYNTDKMMDDIAIDQTQAVYTFGDYSETAEYDNGVVNYLTNGGRSTAGEFKQVIEMLSDDVKASFVGFSVHFDLRSYGTQDHMLARLEYHEEAHKYGLYDAYLANQKTSYGRYITPDEEYSGAKVVVIRDYTINDDPPPDCQLGDTITLFGEEYEVIGKVNQADSGFSSIDMPFLAVPDEMPVSSIGFLEGKVITTQAFKAVNDAMRRVYGDSVNIPIMPTVDVKETKFYTSIVIISVVLSAIAAITLAILFSYIVYTRRRTVSVLRLAGCTRGAAARMYITEAVGVSAVIFAVCAAVYHRLLLPRLTYFFPKITEVYTLETYGYIFGVFIAVLLFIISIMVLSQLDRQPVEMFRRAGG
ncbi:MAG: ABC transporter permease [Ruminococcus sp.]|nr:ABC transporter permease [Ruminococcus sp.]